MSDENYFKYEDKAFFSCNQIKSNQLMAENFSTLKEILKVEGKWYLSEIHIYTSKRREPEMIDRWTNMKNFLLILASLSCNWLKQKWNNRL